jgi:hypothetical protein
MDQTLTDAEIDGLKAHLLKNGVDPYEVHDQIEAIRSKYGPGQGKTAQDPAAGQLFSDSERVLSGFGNPQGMAPTLAQKGFKNPRLIDGEYEAQDPSGKWVRDESNFFRRGSALSPKSWIPQHPINWLEAKAGKALPLAGQVAGNVAGDIAGFASGPAAPVAVPALGAAGGAAGGYTGEGVRQVIGDALGVYQGDGMNDAADSAKEGFIGGLLGGLPIPGAGKLLSKEAPVAGKAAREGLERGWATVGELGQEGVNRGLNLGRKTLAKGAGFISGLTPENVETLLKSPLSVWKMGREGSDVELAKQGQKEVTGKIKELGKNVEYANRGMNMGMGQAPIDPRRAMVLVREMNEALAPYRKGGAFAGKMTDTEIQELDDLIEQHMYRALSPGRPAPGTIPRNLVKTKQIGTESVPSNLGNYFTTEAPIHQVSIPSAHVEGLQEAANTLGREVGSGWDVNPIGTKRSEAAEGLRKRFYGLVKNELHLIDNGRNGLAEADAAFHAARDAGKLLAPLNDGARQQGFVHQLANSPVKDAARQAAAGAAEEGIPAMAPEMAGQLPALRAALEMAKKTTQRNGVMTGAGGIAALGHTMQQPILTYPAMAALALGAAGHPVTIKYGLGGAAAVTSPLWSLLRSKAGSQGLIDLGVPTGLDALSETLKNQ